MVTRPTCKSDTAQVHEAPSQFPEHFCSMMASRVASLSVRAVSLDTSYLRPVAGARDIDREFVECGSFAFSTAFRHTGLCFTPRVEERSAFA